MLKSSIERLKELTERLASFPSYDIITELSTNLVFLAQDGIILKVNRYAKNILGYGPEEFIGKHWGDFIHPDDLAASLAANPDKTEGKIFEVVNRMRSRDGTYRTISWRCTNWKHGQLYAIGKDRGTAHGK
jgi:PAS domain S-box-containing protein